MAWLLELGLWLTVAPALLCCAYLGLLTLLSGAPSPPPRPARRLRFALVVPAHNEAVVIERTVRSLCGVDWPADRFDVFVIAHNCSDDTGALAANAGAQVLVRNDPAARGKGDALAFAFGEVARLGRHDAVLVVDADTVVSANLLEACAARLEAGAGAVQVHYGVLNPLDSWRTRLLTIAKSCFHRVRSRGRERLGLSCGVRGTGWAVTLESLRKVPYGAFSLTEDIEYGLQLGLAGIRVAYADEADADPELASTEEVTASQRQRWEHGRRHLRREFAPTLLRAALARPSRVCLDLALDLLLPPLSYVVLVLGTGILLALARAALGLGTGWLWLALAAVALLAAHVLRGWQLSGLGLEGLKAIGRVPGFLVRKVVLMARPHDNSRWVRTDRERP